MRPRYPESPSRSYSLRDVLEARTQFLSTRTDEPRYLVIDPLTWLAIKTVDLWPEYGLFPAPANAVSTIAGMVVVVIQTDGIPMLHVVGSNDSEVDKHLRGVRDHAAQPPEALRGPSSEV